jgi:N-dimethylarginine dimethylaminohydrolase
MTYSVHNHWDHLDTCIVGKTYPPEFYSWIKDVKTRNRFENLANETEEDYQHLIGVLKTKFGVKVRRPEFPKDLNELWLNDKWVQPPIAPRDYFIMIHDKFWVPNIPNLHHAQCSFERKYNSLTGTDRELAWQKFQAADQLHLYKKLGFYNHVFEEIKQSGTELINTKLDFINGCFVTRLDDRMYFATQSTHDNDEEILKTVNQLFPNTHNKVVPAAGHGDAVYCPVTEGLIISINDMPTYKDSFPGWEVVYLPESNFAYTDKFKSAMVANKGRWFVPGFEKDHNMMHLVDHYFDEWVGQASETQFQVNILIVNPKNIIVSSHNSLVEAACARYGIEVHVVPFRHKYFWDAGTHCITNDINRIK